MGRYQNSSWGKVGDSIKTALNEAKVAILLISADFLASRFISENELPPLLAAEEDEGLAILPVILKPSSFNRIASLSQFQAINSVSKPLLALSDVEQEQIWVDLSKRVEDILKQSISVSPPPKASIRTPKATSLENFSEPLGNDVKLEMVAIPGGGFWMGSPESEEERLADEGPQQYIKLSPFLFGKYPITQAQWKQVSSLPQIQIYLNPSPSYFPGMSYPVERISWYEAVEFCARLSRATGKDYRLPSESEWEYTCRAGTESPFFFGETITTEQANFDGRYTYKNGLEGSFRKRTIPVNTFTDNAFGLLDMHGNVREWCADTWHDNYVGLPLDGIPWTVGGDQTCRVLRGGCWDAPPAYCRSAYRRKFQAKESRKYFGFRVACSSV